MNTAVTDPIWSTFISIFAVQLPWKRWRKNALTKLSPLTPPVATRQSSPWRYYEHTPGQGTQDEGNQAELLKHV